MFFCKAFPSPGSVVVLLAESSELRGRDDVGVEGDSREPPLLTRGRTDFVAKPLVEPRFLIVLVGGRVEHAMRFDENDVLPLLVLDPEYEVRVETAILEETDARPSGEIPKQEEADPSIGGTPCDAPEGSEIPHEIFFALDQPRRRHGQVSPLETKQRLVQMSIELK